MTSGIYKRTPEMKTGKYKRTPEIKSVMSKAHTGVPLSPEHCAAMSDGMTNSEAAKVNADRMWGGFDLVWHHVSYDFGRTKALTVKITRKFHSSIHHPKGCKFGTYGYSLID